MLPLLAMCAVAFITLMMTGFVSDANAQGRDAHGRPCEADIYFGGCKGESTQQQPDYTRFSKDLCGIVEGKSVRYGRCAVECKNIYPCKVNGRDYIPLKKKGK